MLADRASEALSTRFAAQWLRLQDLEKIDPDDLLFPHFDDTLARRDDARDRAVLRQHRPRGPERSRSAHRRLHVRQRAARASTTASRTSPATQFRRVHVARRIAAGVLGQGSILMLTSVADRTSPVLRGKWVMEVLLGTPPPPPPPNVPALDDSVKANEGGHDAHDARSAWKSTGRTRRATPATASSIRSGLALENFDVDRRLADQGQRSAGRRRRAISTTARR